MIYRRGRSHWHLHLGIDKFKIAISADSVHNFADLLCVVIWLANQTWFDSLKIAFKEYFWSQINTHNKWLRDEEGLQERYAEAS